jgi:transcriptional regulator with XRE-family HTH domain
VAQTAPETKHESAVDLDTDETVIAIGARIRRLRSERNLTLQAMSARTGLSASMLSMVERGRTSPSIGTLVAMASALRVHMTELFDVDDDDAGASPIHRQADQPKFETSAGVQRRVAHNDRTRGIEVSVNEYLPGTSSSATPVHHEGIEYGIVLEGRLTVELDGVEHELKVGDSISYDSSASHRISNPGRSKARTIWVNLER